MKAWIKRHKILTAFVGSLLLCTLLEIILRVDIAFLMGALWGIFGFAWLIWEYPKWSAKRKRRKANEE